MKSRWSQAEAQRFQLEATYLTLASNVALTAITEASLRAQIAATEDIVRVEQDSLDILKHQFNLGQVAGADVAWVPRIEPVFGFRPRFWLVR